jgi:glycosyltransferase involved in cell wall biosynthesis
MIHQVVADLLAQTTQTLLVVDDGSMPPLQLPADQRLSLLRLSPNQGKGHALQQAMGWARARGYSCILSFDGDGQHRAQDIATLLQAAALNPHALLIGARRFDDSVPGISRFGRRFSNFWVWYQTGVTVEDSQSGLRLYPLEPFTGMHFFTRRYDFEIEVLVRWLWQGRPVQSLPVGVIYGPPGERISHFHKFWDNARITGLNIILIAYTLLLHQRTPLKIMAAGAVGFGLSLYRGVGSLVGVVLLGVLICVVLRLNVVMVFSALLAVLIF